MEVKIKKINILAVLDFWTKKEEFHKKKIKMEVKNKQIIRLADLDF